jgi:hypothetical protein
MLALTESAAGAVPLAGVTLSHGWSSDALKLSVPPPLFVTLTVCAGGFAPPCVALKASVAGATARTGVDGLTVSVTSIVFGDPLTPAALTVIWVV